MQRQVKVRRGRTGTGVGLYVEQKRRAAKSSGTTCSRETAFTLRCSVLILFIPGDF